MANLTIEKYFSDNYNKWLRRAQNLCYQYDVSRDNAEDILHDAIRVVCEKYPEQTLLELLSTQIPPYTLLDLWISRATSYNTMSFGDRCKRIRSKKIDIDVNFLNVIDHEDTPHYDIYGQQQYLSKVISEIDVDDRIKNILRWKLVDNNLITSFRGIETNKKHDLYYAGLQQLQASL